MRESDGGSVGRAWVGSSLVWDGTRMSSRGDSCPLAIVASRRFKRNRLHKNDFRRLGVGVERAQVAIAGAGPNGLMVACELALAGISPVVIERLTGPNEELRANGLVGQVVRALDIRGLYTEMSGRPGPPRPAAAHVFAGMDLPLTGVNGSPLYTVPISQPKLVALLARRAKQLGVQIRWASEVADVRATDDGVSLSVAGPQWCYQLDTEYLVGADGGRSLVRKAAGIGFPGVTTPTVSRMAHVHMPEEYRSDGGWWIPEFGRIELGLNRFDRGSIVAFDRPIGLTTLGVIEIGDPAAVDDAPISLDEFRQALRRVAGVEVPFEPPHGPGPHLLTRIVGQNTRQADRYSEGNIFLVGDSAHVHAPIGGPGLNLGLQDAMNLGWKLATALKSRDCGDLLATYASERYPVGQRVMMHSLAQLTLVGPGPEVSALRELMGELLELPQTASHIAHLLAGTDIRYEVESDHPLAGRFMPEISLADGRSAAQLFHDGHAVLLDRTGGEVARAAVESGAEVDVLVDAAATFPAVALLIRPDGYVAWAGETFARDSEQELLAALRRWKLCNPERDEP